MSTLNFIEIGIQLFTFVMVVGLSLFVMGRVSSQLTLRRRLTEQVAGQGPSLQSRSGLVRSQGVTNPFLLWVLAMASFVPPVANDYNLFFLPLAALAVWDRRDPVYVHVMMAFLLLWWQPLALPIDGRMILVFKLAGLLAVALCLSGRAGEVATERFTAENAEDAERKTEKYNPKSFLIFFLRFSLFSSLRALRPLR